MVPITSIFINANFAQQATIAQNADSDIRQEKKDATSATPEPSGSDPQVFLSVLPRLSVMLQQTSVL